jgi:hypothetical protein
MRTFWVAVSCVKGGTGGRDSFALLIVYLLATWLHIEHRLIDRRS